MTLAGKHGGTGHLPRNDPREVFGWKMYDWANSAFYTTVVGALYSVVSGPTPVRGAAWDATIGRDGEEERQVG